MNKDTGNTDLDLSKAKGVPPMRLPLGSLKNARRSLSRLMTSFYRGQLDPETYRGMIYGFNVLLSFLKEERNDDIETRLTALENQRSERK